MFREDLPSNSIRELKFMLFEDSSLMGAFIQYLRELKKLNGDVFKGFCQKMENGDITSPTALFQDFELIDEKLGLNITKDYVQNNLNINFDKFLNKPEFIQWCKGLKKTIRVEQLLGVVTDTMTAEKESAKITGFFYEGSMNEWETFWEDEVILDEKDKQQLKAYAENAVRSIIAGKIFAWSQNVLAPKELQDVLFKSTFLMDAFVNYLNELSKLNKDVFNCLHYRIVEKNLNVVDEDGENEFAYTQRLFAKNFELEDKKLEVKVTAPLQKKKEGVAPAARKTDLNYEINYVAFSAKPEFKTLCLTMDKCLNKDPKKREEELIAVIMTAFHLHNEKEANTKGHSSWEDFWKNIVLDEDADHTKKTALRKYVEECICFNIKLNIQSVINFENSKKPEEEKKKKPKTTWQKSYSAIFDRKDKEKNKPAKHLHTSSPESSTRSNLKPGM